MKQLNWKFSNLKQCSECDYVWFGPPVSRNLILDDDFLDLRKYPTHRSSKMPGMSQAMTKSEFSRAILTLEKFIGHDFKFEFSPCTFIYPDHMKLIMEYVDDITTNKVDNDRKNDATYNDSNNQYMIIKPSVGSQGKDILISHVDDLITCLTSISNSNKQKEDDKNKLKINPNTNPIALEKLLKYQAIIDKNATLDERVIKWNDSFKHEYVVQKYIDNPYLIHKYKFDIRLYVVSY